MERLAQAARALKYVPEVLASIAVDLYRRNPARVISFAAAVIVGLAAKLGVIVKPQPVQDVLVYVLPILLAGQATHRKVTPAP